MISLIILTAMCLVSVRHPVWGVGLVILTQCSIFNLARFATVPLPVGFMGPSDVLFPFLLLGAYIHRFRIARPSASLELSAVHISYEADKYIEGILAKGVLPYVIWIGLCGVANLLFPPSMVSINPIIRGYIAHILPWSMVAVVWFLRDQIVRLMRVILAIGALTAVINASIHIFSLRFLFYQAYWASQEGIGVYQQYLLENADYVRALPQGTILILFLLIFSFAYNVLRDRTYLSNLNSSLLFVIFSVTIWVTLTRSLVVEAVAGLGVVVLLSKTAHAMAKSTQRAVVVVGILFVFLVFMIPAVRSEVNNLMVERFDMLPKDVDIFHTETDRGINNLSAVSAIWECPFLGYGTTELAWYHSYGQLEYNFSDIHPLLEIALLAGIPGLLLILYVQLYAMRRFWVMAKKGNLPPHVWVPYLSVLMAATFVVNTVGAGGTLSGSSLIAMSYLIGLTAASYSRYYLAQVKKDGGQCT